MSHIQFETSLGRKLYLRMSQEEIVGGFKDEDYKAKHCYFEYPHRDVVEQCFHQPASGSGSESDSTPTVANFVR